MKNQMTSLFLIAMITFSAALTAEEVAIPVISKPAILEEGTQRGLSAAQVAELLPWAKNSKIFLIDLLDNIQNLSMADKVERLVEGIREVVPESAPKNSELLMRYALNRGLILNDIISKEMDADEVGTVDAQFRVLRSSILMALNYYDYDIASMTNKAAAPYIKFGLDYFDFLNELNKSIFDASAQYNIQRVALEWLQWDLYRDVKNTAYASQIVKINNALKTFPNKKLKDSQSIAFIRQMKAVAVQLQLKETADKIAYDAELILARNEEEKRQILIRREAAAQLALEEERQQRERAELEAFNSGKPLAKQVLSIGDQVLHKGAQIRTVQNLTDDGQVILSSVAYAYNQEVAKRDDLQKFLDSYLGLKNGNLVLHGNTVRTVQGVGEKGLVVLSAVSYTYNTTYVFIKGITPVVSSYGKYKTGDKVLYQGNLRTIQYLDNTGRLVLAAVAYSYGQAFITVNDVSKIQ